MELKWLKDFLTLSSEGNFRIAAQQRHVSQPAFSRRIQALESWVGAALIDRRSQPAQLTEAGKIFLPVAQNIVDLAKEGRTEVLAQVQEEKGKMRFSTLSTLSQVFLPVWLRNLQPHISITRFVIVTEHVTIADYFAALKDNKDDFFICYQSLENPLQHDSSLFTSLSLGKDSFVPVVAPNERAGPRWWLPDRVQDVIPCLHTLADNSPWPIKSHMKKLYGDLTFKSVYDSSTGTTLREMAIEGFGLAWLPLKLVADDLESGRLVRAADPADDILVDIIIYRHLKNSEPRVKNFWGVLLERENL